MLLGGPRHDVGHGYEPLLPDGHLEHGAPILAVVVAQKGHVCEEDLLDLEQGLRRFRLADQRRHHFEHHGILQSQMRFRLRVSRAQYLLCYLLNPIENQTISFKKKKKIRRKNSEKNEKFF